MSVIISGNTLPMLLGPYAASYSANIMDGLPNEYEQIVTKKTGFDSNQYLSAVMYGFPLAPQKADGANVEYQSFGELFRIQTTFKEIAIAFAISKAAVEDGEAINLTEIGVRHAYKSMDETKNVEAANILNNGFTTTGYDGVSFFSTAHPGNSATYSNQFASNPALSQSNFEAALTTIISATDPSGKIAGLLPEKLVVPPALWATSQVILNSAGRSGTTNNDMNPIKVWSSLDADPAVMRRLTSSTAWFVMTKGADEARAIIYAERASREQNDDVDFNTGTTRFKFRDRYVFLPENPLALYGSSGAGS